MPSWVGESFSTARSVQRDWFLIWSMLFFRVQDALWRPLEPETSMDSKASSEAESPEVDIREKSREKKRHVKKRDSSHRKALISPRTEREPRRRHDRNLSITDTYHISTKEIEASRYVYQVSRSLTCFSLASTSVVLPSFLPFCVLATQVPVLRVVLWPPSLLLCSTEHFTVSHSLFWPSQLFFYGNCVLARALIHRSSVSEQTLSALLKVILNFNEKINSSLDFWSQRQSSVPHSIFHRRRNRTSKYAS